MQGLALLCGSGCVTDQPSRGWAIHGNLASMQSEHCEMHTAAPMMVKMSEAIHNISVHMCVGVL
jgi:hypothetical protein